jgi:hypothetical protein
MGNEIANSMGPMSNAPHTLKVSSLISNIRAMSDALTPSRHRAKTKPPVPRRGGALVGCVQVA